MHSTHPPFFIYFVEQVLIWKFGYKPFVWISLGSHRFGCIGFMGVCGHLFGDHFRIFRIFFLVSRRKTLRKLKQLKYSNSRTHTMRFGEVLASFVHDANSLRNTHITMGVSSVPQTYWHICVCGKSCCMLAHTTLSRANDRAHVRNITYSLTNIYSICNTYSLKYRRPKWNL